MRFSNMAIAAALYGVLFAGAAKADGLRQPTSFQRTSYQDYYQETGYQESPSDTPQAPAGGCGVVPGGDCGCNLGNCGCECAPEVESDVCERWYLFPETCGGWRLHGFINAGATANAASPASHFNGPVTFNDREEARLSQLYGILERKMNFDESCWSWGARVDLLYGTDYVFTQAAGLETQPDGTNKWNGTWGAGPGLAHYGLAMPQAYGEFGTENLSFRLGHFYAPVGYQVVNADGNFFISQPYTFQYGEPFTLTGAMATLKYSDETQLIGGIMNGWDKFDAVTDKIGLFGGWVHTPEHGKYVINNMTYVGEEDGIVAPTLGTRFLNSFVFTYNLTERFQYVFQNDIGWQQNAIAGVGGAPAQDAEWYGINQYWYYTINDCWKLGLRAEWFRDDDGVRGIAAPVRFGGLANVAPAVTPAQVAGHYFNVAPGINWSPTKNFRVRSELRWDWSNGNAIAPFDDLTKDSQFLAAVDAILLW